MATDKTNEAQLAAQAAAAGQRDEAGARLFSGDPVADAATARRLLGEEGYAALLQSLSFLEPIETAFRNGEEFSGDLAPDVVGQILTAVLPLTIAANVEKDYIRGAAVDSPRFVIYQGVGTFNATINVTGANIPKVPGRPDLSVDAVCTLGNGEGDNYYTIRPQAPDGGFRLSLQSSSGAMRALTTIPGATAGVNVVINRLAGDVRTELQNPFGLLSRGIDLLLAIKGTPFQVDQTQRPQMRFEPTMRGTSALRVNGLRGRQIPGR